VARAAPSGPTYLMLPREALMEPPGEETAALAVPRPPAADPDGLREVARRLADAHRPVIVTDRLGRRPQAVDMLVRIAELVGALVVETRDAANFPPRHPLYAGPKAADILKGADVVLLLESEVPWVPAAEAPPPETVVLQIDLDCVKRSMPSWRYPIDLSLTADSTTALPALLAELSALATPECHQAWVRNRAQAEAVAGRVRAASEARATSEAPDDAPDAMLAALDRALPADALTIEEAVTNKPACTRQLHRPPGRHFGIGAPALGGGLGAALGAKLADPAAPVVAITGDGAFNFGIPTAALWSAQRAGAPFVTVILDNGSYLASRRPVEALFPEGAARRANTFPETKLGGELDYAALARACGGEGLVVERPDQMGDAFQQALAATTEGRCAVIDARLPAPT
ncbi:MAG: acetolactate synthase, partial [Candidatus Dormibacteraeota bacterium]|nr:acetolactate synthase [Candidatus Dormibacteraeota bacterium]